MGKKIGVIGAGAWGTTLAKILTENGHDVTLWAHMQSIADEINNSHENKTLFAGFPLPKQIKASTNLASVCTGKYLVVFVVASQFFSQTAKQALPYVSPGTLLLSATKGIDRQTGKRMSEVLSDFIPDGADFSIAALSGPNISKEIALKKPSATVIASSNPAVATNIQKLFNNKYFRVYTNSDIIGTELGGALKNIIAIAAGINDGLQLGDNTKSTMMVRGLVEITRFAFTYGAKPETFSGLAGMGDLITTCASPLSRNHFVGEQLGKGKSLPDILSHMNAVAEGVETTRLIYNIAQKKDIEMPMTEQIYKVLFEDKQVGEALDDLMTRESKPETIV